MILTSTAGLRCGLTLPVATSRKYPIALERKETQLYFPADNIYPRYPIFMQSYISTTTCNPKANRTSQNE